MYLGYYNNNANDVKGHDLLGWDMLGKSSPIVEAKLKARLKIGLDTPVGCAARRI